MLATMASAAAEPVEPGGGGRGGGVETERTHPGITAPQLRKGAPGIEQGRGHNDAACRDDKLANYLQTAFHGVCGHDDL